MKSTIFFHQVNSSYIGKDINWPRNLILSFLSISHSSNLDLIVGVRHEFYFFVGNSNGFEEDIRKRNYKKLILIHPPQSFDTHTQETNF